MYTKESQLLFLTRTDKDHLDQPKGLNFCLRIPFRPWCLQSNWLVSFALCLQCLMQSVCFGLIDEIEAEVVYLSSLALGVNCFFLFMAVLFINMAVCCNHPCGENEKPFSEA